MGSINLQPNNLQKKPSASADDTGLRELPPLEDIRQEECARIMQILKGKLPGGLTAAQPELMDSLEQAVGEALERHCQAVCSRCAAPEDKAASAECQRYTAEELAGLMNSLGGADRFNTGEIEAQNVPQYANNLEAHTNKLLRSSAADAAAFLAVDNTHSVVKCVFRDNALKPKTVVDVKLAINIPGTALIGPEWYRYALGKYILTDLVSPYIVKNIDKEMNALAAGEFNFEKIIGTSADIAPDGFSPPTDGTELVRSGGFNSAADALCALLNDADMGFQFIKNNQNGRELIVNEYEDNDPLNLPDEHFSIRLAYLEQEHLAEERQAYDTRIMALQKQVQHLGDLIEVMYRDSKSIFKVNDFEDLARKNKSRIKALRKDTIGEPAYEGAAKVPDEFSLLRTRLTGMHERIRNMYEFLYPVERRILEERLAGLEREYARCAFLVNPHHLQAGLVLDMEITSIKRKKTTLDSMSRVLTEFLANTASGFQNAALAVFGRQKLTSPAKASRRR